MCMQANCDSNSECESSQHKELLLYSENVRIKVCYLEVLLIRIWYCQICHHGVFTSLQPLDYHAFILMTWNATLENSQLWLKINTSLLNNILNRLHTNVNGTYYLKLIIFYFQNFCYYYFDWVGWKVNSNSNMHLL